MTVQELINKVAEKQPEVGAVLSLLTKEIEFLSSKVEKLEILVKHSDSVNEISNKFHLVEDIEWQKKSVTQSLIDMEISPALEGSSIKFTQKSKRNFLNNRQKV